MSLSWSCIPAAIRTGGVAAVLGFVISCSSSSSRTVNGRIVECSYFDAGALVAGVVAILGALVGVAGLVKSERKDRIALLGAAAIIVLLGVVHLLRGVGTIGGPCN